MPRGNGTGPNGMGPMTGRAAGFCTGYGVPGYANPGYGRGFGSGRGFGYGRGFGWGRTYGSAVPFVPPAGYAPGPDTERKSLEYQADLLEEELQTIRRRLDALGNTEENS